MPANPPDTYCRDRADHRDMAALVGAQRAFFASGATRSLRVRRKTLEALASVIRLHEAAILEALRADLGKSAQDAYATEVGYVLAEIDAAVRHLGRWMRPERVRTPLMAQPGVSRIVPEPRGVTLILGPWNYPFQLLLSPLVASLAAGNTAVLKPSEHAPSTAALLEKLLRDAFPREQVCVVTGDAAVATALLADRFDHIFFTGSTAVGRLVAQAAARTLSPCTLELGGKSPCIVCADADLRVAARRIVWGKFLNAGQTCVAPDFVWADRRIAAALLDELCRVIADVYGLDPLTCPGYGRIVNTAHFDRLTALLPSGRIVCGGSSDRASRAMAPTVIADPAPDSPVMQDEIFGPILPVLVYESLEAVLEDLRQRPVPLALYIFSGSRATQERILNETRSGGACVNDTVLQILNPRLPFGGLGESGQGAYHGRAGFDTFSHYRAVLRRGTRFACDFRQAPAPPSLRWLRRLLPWLLR